MKNNNIIAEPFTGDPIQCTMQPCSKLDISELCFGENKCLKNAYLSAKNNGHNMVEGVLLIISNGEIINAVRHCWNICDSGYYDVTKDFIWEKEEFQKKLKDGGIYSKPEYLYYSCYEAPIKTYEKDGTIEFKYDYSRLIVSLKNGNAKS